MHQGEVEAKAELPERDPLMLYTLQTASWETLPILKETSVKLILGGALITCVFVASITDEFFRAFQVPCAMTRQ